MRLITCVQRDDHGRTKLQLDWLCVWAYDIQLPAAGGSRSPAYWRDVRISVVAVSFSSVEQTAWTWSRLYVVWSAHCSRVSRCLRMLDQLPVASQLPPPALNFMSSENFLPTGVRRRTQHCEAVGKQLRRINYANRYKRIYEMSRSGWCYNSSPLQARSSRPKRVSEFMQVFSATSCVGLSLLLQALSSLVRH